MFILETATLDLVRPSADSTQQTSNEWRHNKNWPIFYGNFTLYAAINITFLLDKEKINYKYK
jgi:hypothetical protein